MGEYEYEREREPLIVNIENLGDVPATKTGLTDFGTAVNLFKCVIGAGCFVLPYAFMKGGLWFSVFALIALGALCAYTIGLLSRVEREVAFQTRREKLTYPELGYEVYNMAMAILIALGVILTIIGVCAFYVDFIADTMHTILNERLTVKEIKGIVFVPIILLSWIRSHKYLAFTSILGDVAVTLGMATVIGYGFAHNDLIPVDDLPAIRGGSISVFFSKSIFLFAIHAVTVPIGQSMKDPSRFPRVVNYTFAAITVVNVIFAALAYSLFGDNIQILALFNLSGTFGDVVQVLVCVDLFFTIPIVLTAPREIFEDNVIKIGKVGPARDTLVRNLVRTLMVCLIMTLAFLVDDIDMLTDMVGAVLSPWMAFIAPPLLYLKVFRGQISVAARIGQYLIIAFGIATAIFSVMNQVCQHHETPMCNAAFRT
eukprot:Opistho-2@45508